MLTGKALRRFAEITSYNLKESEPREIPYSKVPGSEVQGSGVQGSEPPLAVSVQSNRKINCANLEYFHLRINGC